MTQNFWAVLSAHPLIGARSLHRLRLGFNSPEEVLGASTNDYRALGIDETTCGYLIEQRTKNPVQIFAEMERNGIEYIWFDDEEFPTLLSEIADPPACLYRRGAPLTNNPAIAVVGSRKATPYGRQATTDIVAPLAQAGVEIVSGLAFGIDAIAHQATLDVGGRTVAVLANGLNDVFPSSHRALAREIVAKGGTIVSEFPPGTPPLKHHFPIRNRIIAGLSLGTLVVEAAEQSGSLITAGLAINYNRDVFAVPGPITSLVSAGPHGLIRMGARLVTSASDILSELSLEHLEDESTTKEIAADSEIEAKLLKILSRAPMLLDNLIRESQLDAATVSSTLLLMEMKGKARNLGANQYVIGH